MRALCLTLSLVALGCGPAPLPRLDPTGAGTPGQGGGDAGRDDAGVDDAGTDDAGTEDAGTDDAGTDDAGPPADAGLADAGAGGAGDAGVADAGPRDAGAPSSHVGWARYTIPAGSHTALVAQNGAPQLPLAGLSTASARGYQFIFDASAMYVLTNPAQPGDQLDWNKLPGLSDCGQFDLARDGLMFAWRWRVDLSPPVLELAHYANNAGTHLYPAQGLVTLDEADLRAEEPLRYELSISGTEYRFHLFGTVRGRVIDVSATHPRRCATSAAGGLKWASGFYFGGTSVAPSTITGWVLEPG